jgi:hypothetical protein
MQMQHRVRHEMPIPMYDETGAPCLVALDVDEVRVWEPVGGWAPWEPVERSMRCGRERVLPGYHAGWFETADSHIRLRAPDPLA